ncbi:NADH:flavin oxidoreductase/NADH oxidase [Pluteus cervinus]|uniref:NADH:flavin oxidoreductase/NADH oxidase n=1 Tax=Pluteus cervinus TaxID=181527 RepID=A0ACD3ALI1_9AGAR|nr:NADH:flavin oxidoreductase/NADH oxidase [Pluteus cervinus]
MSSQPKLFQPIKVGDITLQHRLVLAPLTRTRSDRATLAPIFHLVKPYYEQRASTPGTLLITEATSIAAKAARFPNAPGIYSQEQIDAWKQLGDYSIVGASSIPTSPETATVTPHALTKPEIQEYIQLFAQAAKNAVLGAGFDGVEIHGAHGFLVDQFLQDVSNDRTDEYGGSIENRSRFALEVVDAVVGAVGPQRSAIRLSPWATVQDMGMKDPIPQFTHVVSEIKQRHPDLAYIHVVEPRVNGTDDATAVLGAGGYVRESALKVAEEKGDIIASGRWFISNPDLPIRIKKDVPWTKYGRKTFYVPGQAEGLEKGYLDYPFATPLEVKN